MEAALMEAYPDLDKWYLETLKPKRKQVEPEPVAKRSKAEHNFDQLDIPNILVQRSSVHGNASK
jgi:hypothetical protein